MPEATKNYEKLIKSIRVEGKLRVRRKKSGKGKVGRRKRRKIKKTLYQGALGRSKSSRRTKKKKKGNNKKLPSKNIFGGSFGLVND